MEKIVGLTSRQVSELTAQGAVNKPDMPKTRSVGQILLSNLFTYFNLINVVLFVLVLMVNSPQNGLFITIIIANTVIKTYQEIRSKKIIDKLAILTQSTANVLRDGRVIAVPVEELVLGDIVNVATGDQVPSDMQVLQGHVEVNESLLTGEADNLAKTIDDELYSGSFVTAGECWCKVIHVGKDNYVSKITREAKEYKAFNSELRNSINAILQVVSFLIIPLGVLTFSRMFLRDGSDLQSCVLSTVSSVLGMIPEGLVLLTSLALTLGCVKLAQKKTLVQELYCIETLAHVDTLCLDKTGTITEGTMAVQEIIPYAESGMDIDQLKNIMANITHNSTDQNATATAIKEYFSPANTMKLDHVVPFSSDKKYSGVVFEEGTYYMGAVTFLFKEGFDDLKAMTKEKAQDGLRVITLAYSPNKASDNELPEGLKPIALITITDVIRENAAETLKYFGEQGVNLKIISGDDPVTVSAIGKRVGLPNAEKYIDAGTIKTQEEMEAAVIEYTVFGRVTPSQKKEMVLALKKAGRHVAMTGDGVNDVLALKEADCGIAMASGSDAAKNIANVVLLDSDFSSMPEIVNQGRRVVNNIRRAASMFVIKTMFSLMLTLVTIIFGYDYPFVPIQMSLISACAVGIPTFFLAQEPDTSKIDHTFLRHVFYNAFPTAFTITITVMFFMVMGRIYEFPATATCTACFLVTGWAYMGALRTIYTPLDKFRKTIIYTMNVAFFIIAFMFRDLLTLMNLDVTMMILMCMFLTFQSNFVDIVGAGLNRFSRWFIQKGKAQKMLNLFNRMRKYV